MVREKWAKSYQTHLSFKSKVNDMKTVLKIIAIDPGPLDSAYVLWDGINVESGLPNNGEFMELFETYDFGCQALVIEKVECFGMPVGKSIFDTVFWSGRFCQRAVENGQYFYRVGRRDVKLHLCGTARSKDSNVIQALVDRFAPYEKNKGKGTKKEPGFFYGFRKDIWQAFALAVTWWDLNKT